MPNPPAAALDRNYNPVPMIAGDFADIRTLSLVTADDTPLSLDDIIDYPDNPVVIAWLLHNTNAGANNVAWVSGSDVAMGHGIFVNRQVSGVPGALQLMTDPAKTWLIQKSGGPLTFKLVLIGKKLEAPS